MNTGQRFAFGGKKEEVAEVFVGNVGATSIKTPSEISNFFSLNSSDVFDFEVIGGVNVFFKTKKQFLFRSQKPRNEEVTYIVINSKLFVEDGNGTFFENSTMRSFHHRNNQKTFGAAGFRYSNLKHLFFEFATILGRPNTFDSLNDCRIYIDKVTMEENVSVINTASNVTFYINENAPINILNRINVNGSNTVLISDYTTPNTVSDLSFSNLLNKEVQLDFTEISNSDFYEVWIYDGVNEKTWRMLSEIQGSGGLIELPRNSTEYIVKIATCDQYWNGSGFFEDEERRAFSNEININTQ